ncbi:MAG: hypothetical protein KME17_03565 [Cyanosarcina radialis HA8281-LM2]|jgi:hypothetical protein|nr:hypothetical protein [Cyanosarcina radialis HA8281-LM2]
MALDGVKMVAIALLAEKAGNSLNISAFSRSIASSTAIATIGSEQMRVTDIGARPKHMNVVRWLKFPASYLHKYRE